MIKKIVQRIIKWIMANYESLKTAIRNAVYENGNNEITGQALQDVLEAIVNSLGAGYQFASVATTETEPGTPDSNVMYIAGAGTYPNFGGTVVPKGGLGIFRYNGEWVYSVIDVASWADASNKLYYNTQAGNVAAKTIQADGFTLQAGGWLKVHFDNANTVDNPTLNVNNTGAHTMTFNGRTVSATNSWKAGETVAFYYDNYGVGIWRGIRLVELPDFLNVNDLIGQNTPFASASAARSAIPQQNRKPGLYITYLLTKGENTSQWVQDMFIGNDVTDWSETDNWKVVGPVSVSQNSQTGHTDINIGSDSYPVASVEEVSQLGEEINLKIYGKAIVDKHPIWSDGFVSGSTGTVTANPNYQYSQPILLKAGESITYKTAESFNKAIVQVNDDSPVNVGDTLTGTIILNYTTPNVSQVYTAEQDIYIVISVKKTSYSVVFTTSFDNSISSKISKEVGEFLGLTSKGGTGIIPYHLAENTLFINDEAIEYNGYNTKYTDLIPCSEGDTFVYLTGPATTVNSSIKQARFFDASKNAVGGLSFRAQFNAEYARAIVAVPSGVSYVRFISNNFTNDGEVPKFFVIKLNDNVFGELGNYIFEDINLLVQGRGSGYMKSSDFRSLEPASFGSKYIQPIPCKPGDSFLYRGHSGYSCMGWFILHDETILDTGQFDGETTIIIKDSYSVDNNSYVPNAIVFQSYGQTGQDWRDIQLEVYRLSQLSKRMVLANDSVNLYDATNKLEGYYYNVNSYTQSEGYALTNPIKVQMGVTYKIPHANAMGGVRRCARCDEQGTYISGHDVIEDGDYDTFTPNFDGYVRFNVGLTVLADRFMVCEASKYPSMFVPYGRFLTDVLVESKDVLGGENNPLYGKILACDGDSICYGVGYRDGYAGIIAKRNNMLFQNLGIGGATLASNTYSGETPRHWISTNVAQLRSDADYIIIEGGVNDSESMGAMSPTDFTGPFDSTTFCGAIDTLCQNLYARFPGKKIGFIIVHAVNAAWMVGGAKYEAVLAGFKKWGIPICDLIEGCPPFDLLPDDDYLRTNYTKDADGWHPNEQGYLKYYCDKIEAWMKTL